ncbi:MAG: hypothetical protein ACE5KH_06775, partial [Candidatus Geothermarchaeales archaeon]
MASLSEEAKEGLAVLGKWCASQNRSFDTHTFRRKMIAKLRDSEMDSDSVLKELKQAQLIRRHKENVWTLTKDGFKL